MAHKKDVTRRRWGKTEILRNVVNFEFDHDNNKVVLTLECGHICKVINRGGDAPKQKFCVACGPEYKEQCGSS